MFNSLTSIDVSLNVLLARLNCHENKLTTLNVKNGNNINMEYLSSRYNPNLTCIEVDDVVYSTTYWTPSVDSTSSFSIHCSAVGIEGIVKDATPLAYPNPTAGTLFLTEQGDVSLKDLTGNIRLKLKNTKQLDMSSLPAGIYFLQYEGSSTKICKVVKE
jgi:hypothetical protein